MELLQLEQIQTQREEAMAETQKFYIQKVEQMELEKMVCIDSLYILNPFQRWNIFV